MASTDRRSARDLSEEIRRQGPRFRFFQAVRLLALCGQPHRHGLPAGLRFGTPLSLSFPASEILDVTTRPEEETQQEADSEVPALQLTVGFMGLTGPSGVLPTAYTELLVERRNIFRDTAAHQFLDLFAHRAISLFYQAWRKHRFYLGVEAGDKDAFTRNTLDLVGVGLKSLQARLHDAGGIPDMFLSHFSGLLAQKPISAVSLAALIRGYFTLDVRIEQFVGQWIAVPEAEQTRLGMQSCALGESACAGARLWDRQNRIRVRLGPLDSATFVDFLPGGTGFAALRELVRFCVGHALACELALILQKECAAGARLDASAPGSCLLGHHAWLHAQVPRQDPDDACFTLLD